MAKQTIVCVAVAVAVAIGITGQVEGGVAVAWQGEPGQGGGGWRVQQAGSPSRLIGRSFGQSKSASYLWYASTAAQLLWVALIAISS